MLRPPGAATDRQAGYEPYDFRRCPSRIMHHAYAWSGRRVPCGRGHILVLVPDYILDLHHSAGSVRQRYQNPGRTGGTTYMKQGYSGLEWTRSLIGAAGTKQAPLR